MPSPKLQIVANGRSDSLALPPRAAQPAAFERPGRDFYRRAGKRAMDLAISFAGLALLSPVLLAVAVLVKCASPGTVLYWQERVGCGGRIFRIAKFRSMVAHADRQGPAITALGDPRVTRLGAMLRKLKIDELPQLWNVLRGEMSLVGPRPELPVYVTGYTEEQRRVLAVRPGITDVASIRYRDEEKILAASACAEEFYRRVVLPHKLELNAEYIQQMSFSFDVRLIFQTLKLLVVSPPSRQPN